MTNLILVPTPVELDVVRSRLEDKLDGWAFQLCGFGLVASAARASRLMLRYQPERVMLIGIAGSYAPDKCEVGTATRFDEVICHGIGVGSGDRFRSANQMGWDQFSGDDAEPHIGDTIALDSSFVQGIPAAGVLVSGCSASETPQEAQWRHRRYPQSVAEDMEGFAVATAAAMASVPLQIIRGISNLAGDRNLNQWSIADALAAASDLGFELANRTWLPDRLE